MKDKQPTLEIELPLPVRPPVTAPEPIRYVANALSDILEDSDLLATTNLA